MQIFIFIFLFISIDRLNCNIYLKKEIITTKLLINFIEFYFILYYII